MALDILQRFLTAKLFDVNGDDIRLNRLRETAGDLSNLLKDAPNRAAAFTMVAIDSEIPADEPILLEVAALLEKRWNSYAGAFAGGMLSVVSRAIILDALSRCLASDGVALAMTATARTFLPILGSQADRSLWADLIDDADGRLETRARKEWALPSSSAAKALVLAMPKVEPIANAGIKREWFAERLSAAVGPQNAEGVDTKGNPHWPNSGQPWSNEFVPIAAKMLGDAIDHVVKTMVEKVNAQAAAAAGSDAIASYISDVSESMAQTSVGLERRTTLLWWKEALYSPSLKRSYRDLNPAIAAGLMAVDAVEITGPFSPRMMEAFLQEAVRSCVPSASSPVQASSLFAEIANGDSPGAELLRGALATVKAEAGRCPLAAVLASGAEVDEQAIKSRLGLPHDLQLTLLDLGVWLFRDMQAGRATEVKRRRGK